MLAEFRNETYLDWKDPTNRSAMQVALASVRQQFDRTYPLVIGGQSIQTEETFTSVNPARPDEVVGTFASATTEHAEQALQAAAAAWPAWRQVPPADRADYLFRAASLMRQRKLEFAAWMVYEVSKSWVEADADVAEAIDFMEYYGREMLRLAAPPTLVQIPSEDSRIEYIPLGVGAIIPPWNFPLAIAVGMTTAAIVAGNTVVLKPASPSAAIAAQFVALLNDDCGLPPGVLNFITGPGDLIGDALVDHPLTRFIAFTGSKEIGLRIFERSAKRQPGQNWLKRTILEMGGKDAIIVDASADLDLAANSITASAFGFGGQKCSACSRAIIVDEVYDDVLQRVVERTKRLTMGDPAEPDNFMGAVIDDKAWSKIRSYLEIGDDEGRLVLGGEAPDGTGYFIPPTIFADVAPDARLATEEVFGPVLAFIRASNFDHAVEIFNGTEFGLTGGLISSDADHLRRAREELHVGNLYLNRKITGALVGAQPFGGFNMSGTDSKAGGPDYLLLFTQAKVITERLR